MAAPYLKSVPGGIELAVAVSPRASATAIAGVLGGRLKVRVAAPPAGGEANAALCEFLAGCLGVRRSAVTVTAGRTSRLKTVRIAGLDEAAAQRRLRAAGVA